jgi:hypothetical protein
MREGRRREDDLRSNRHVKTPSPSGVVPAGIRVASPRSRHSVLAAERMQEALSSTVQRITSGRGWKHITDVA